MLTETYKGRKLRVTYVRVAGRLRCLINGQMVSSPTGRDEESAMAQLRRDVDLVDREPVNGARWGAYMYAPGSFEMCGEGLHPVEPGGRCQHPTCAPGWGQR